mgnify:CR=1 FL=1
MPAPRAKTSTVAIAIVLALSAGGALAATAADTIAARQAGYKKMGAAFKGLNDELKAGSPDKAKLTAYANTMHTQALLVPGWFPKGSGPESGVKTKAKAQIWAESAKFATLGKNLQTETGKLRTIAASGDLDALRAQVRATGGSCKACHDPYRAE